MDNNPRLHRLERQYLTLEPIERPGWILDMGGGGEGVIGQLCGERVVAIDRLRQELEEAPGNALKIVMDAKDLQFLDNTFQTVTAFFFFMFTLPENRSLIFKEIYRVLRPGGVLLLWDLTIPPYPGGEQDIFACPLSVRLPDGSEIETGYGCPWPGHAQTAADFLRIASEAGFCEGGSTEAGLTEGALTTQTRQAEGASFYLELVK